MKARRTESEAPPVEQAQRKRSPAFQFYPDQFVGGAPALMKPIETHVYVWLLCLDWNRGGFEENEAELARWCRISVSQFRKAWPVVRECFERRGDRLANPRLERERAKQQAYSKRMSENGKKGGRPPLPAKPEQSRGLTGEKAAVKPNESIPVSYSPNPVTTTAKTTTSRAPSAAGSKDSWMLPASRVWEARFGMGSFRWGVFGRQCKGLRAHHEPAIIADHLQRYLAKTDGQFVSEARFAATFAEFAPIAASDLVDEYGCLTPLGEKETRPTGLRVA